MNNVFNRVAKWNAARYPREYNHALSVALLREEFQEWLDATSVVDKLDALCDQVYVALGVLWKADIGDEQNAIAEATANETLIKLVEANELWPGYFNGTYLAVFEFENEYPVEQSMHNIIQACLGQMLSMGLSYAQCIEALLIVCDANDSKSIRKTEAHVKANAGDKGPYFVSPEPRLAKLLETR